MKDETSVWMYRIVFPRTLRTECLKRLLHFNIHPASLFPDRGRADTGHGHLRGAGYEDQSPGLAASMEGRLL